MTTTSSRSKNSKKRRSSKSRSRRGARSSNLFVWIFLGVLVVLFAVIAFISRSDIGTGVEITSAEVLGDPLQEQGQQPDGAVGQRAPTLTGTSIDGEEITIEPGDGTPKAIAFLAHWCPHCQREVPTVVSWAENGGVPDGVEVLGVATGIDRNRDNYPPHDWFERENWDFPTLVDGDAAAARAYGLATYPYWVLVDGEGNVVERWSGETTPDQLSQRIGQLAEAGSQ
jgi:thiol-disulfide isomerase/thioredoxin